MRVLRVTPISLIPWFHLCLLLNKGLSLRSYHHSFVEKLSPTAHYTSAMCWAHLEG